MIAQILGFSVLFILIFGGIIGAIVKFILLGNVQTNVSCRISKERMESALKQVDENRLHCQGNDSQEL